MEDCPSPAQSSQGETCEVPTYVSTFEEAKNVLKEYESRTMSKYASWKTDKMFGKEASFEIDKRKILFEDIKRDKTGYQQIMFDGVPFIVLGEKIYCCQYGLDRNISAKRRRMKEEEINKENSVMTPKRRPSRHGTKKLGCLAQITLREIVRFPEYKAKDKTRRYKKLTVDKLRADWKGGQVKEFERRIYIKVPNMESHTGHSATQFMLNDSIVFPALTVTKQRTQSVAAMCRDILNQIRSMTFLVYDEETLLSLREQLANSLNTLESAVPRDDEIVIDHIEPRPSAEDTERHAKIEEMGVPARIEEVGQQSKIENILEHGQIENLGPQARIEDIIEQARLESLGQQARIEGDGESAKQEGIEHHARIEDIIEQARLENLAQQTKIEAIEEPETRKRKAGTWAGRNSGRNKRRAKGIEVSGQIKTEPDTKEQIVTFDADMDVLKKLVDGMLVEDTAKLPKISDPQTTFIIVKDTVEKVAKERRRSRNTRARVIPELSPNEELTIINGGLLSDESINIAQALLAEQFPALDGLQDTIAGEMSSFPIIRNRRKYIQILHTGNLHWVCAVNMHERKTDNSLHFVFDSMTSGQVSVHAVEQIAGYSHFRGKELRIEVMAVQQQENEVDCGVFAIAFAVSLAFGEDPTRCQYDVSRLRSHLVTCLKVKKMIPFPKAENGVICLKCPSKAAIVELFCSCRMPYKRLTLTSMEMADCARCHGSFHKDCENIPDVVFQTTNLETEWYCNSCRQWLEKQNVVV